MIALSDVVIVVVDAGVCKNNTTLFARLQENVAQQTPCPNRPIASTSRRTILF